MTLADKSALSLSSGPPGGAFLSRLHFRADRATILLSDSKTKPLYSVKPGFTTISPTHGVVASFDREGRLFSYVEGGRTYRRTLASAVAVRWREEARRYGWLTAAQARDLFARALQAAADVRTLATGELRRRLDEEILRWTPEKLAAQARQFAQVYKPIAILPPDQYLSVVLQATEGWTWNRCTFCTFYQDRPFRVKSEDEFRHHIDAVKQFFGRGVLMRKSVFLADGNAVGLSQRRLLPMMELTRSALPGLPIYSFIDVYTGERKTVSDWQTLARLGLHRVYIGMETGLDELLSLLHKPGSADELVDFVHTLKAAGLLVGLIVMVGVGGVSYKQLHAEATLRALRRMPLGQGDLVYLSPFIKHPSSAHAALRDQHSLRPMSMTAIEDELNRLAAQVRALNVKCARYDIREFLY